MKKYIIVILVLLITAVVVFKVIGRENSAWKIVKRKPSIEAYEQYIKKYPQGKYIKEALKELEELEWKDIKNRGSIPSYEYYVRQYPQGKYIDEAKEIIEEDSIKSENQYIDKNHNFKKLQQQAEQGNVEAQFDLAEIYEKHKEYKKAYYWYKKARENGNISAQIYLNKLYFRGLGTDIYSEEHISNSSECRSAKNYRKMTTLKELDKYEHCFKSFEAKTDFYLRRYFIKCAKRLKAKELKDIKISRKELLNFITNLVGYLDLSDLCCRDSDKGYFFPKIKDEIEFLGGIQVKKLINTTFMLSANWGGRGNSVEIFTYKKGKFIKVDLNPRKILSKSLDKLVGIDKKTSVYDRIWDISTTKIKGKKYYEILFTGLGDAECCPSYLVAYNKDFNYKGKFYYKKDYNNVGFDKLEWKELKIIY